VTPVRQGRTRNGSDDSASVDCRGDRPRAPAGNCWRCDIGRKTSTFRPPGGPHFVRDEETRHALVRKTVANHRHRWPPVCDHLFRRGRDKRPTVLGIAAEGLSRAANGHLCARARCLFIVQSCNAEPPGSLTYTRVLGNECSREECDGQPISFIRTSVRAGRAARVRRSQCVRGWLLRTVWRPRGSCRVAGRQSIQ